MAGFGFYVGLVTATMGATVVVTWWGGAIFGLTWGAWAWLSNDPANVAAFIGFDGDYLATALIHFGLGGFFALTLPFAVRGAAFVHSRVAYVMLCSRKGFPVKCRG